MPGLKKGPSFIIFGILRIIWIRDLYRSRILGMRRDLRLRGRTVYAIDNGKYGRVEITVNSESNMIEPGTYAITLELYNGDRRIIIIGSSRLSGRCIYIIEAAVNAVLYKRRLQEMMEFEEFCNANNNIPKGILKIPADF